MPKQKNKPLFVQLWHTILDHWIYRNARPWKFRAWIYLLSIASRKEHVRKISGESFNIKIGEVVTTIGQLSNEWDKSKNSVLKFLSQLENDDMIKYYNLQSRIIITIINYERYQNNTENFKNEKNKTAKNRSFCFDSVTDITPSLFPSDSTSITRVSPTSTSNNSSSITSKLSSVNNKNMSTRDIREREGRGEYEGGRERERFFMDQRIREVFDYWVEKLGDPKVTNALGARRKRHINARLKDSTVEEIKAAIDACAASTWHVDNGYVDLNLILRSREKMEEFIRRGQSKANRKMTKEEEIEHYLGTS